VAGDDHGLGPWEPLSPERVGALFERCDAPWWIAGGWALELGLGRRIRDHDDIDLLLLRRDQGRAHEVLRGWELWAADPPGQLRPWPEGEPLPRHVHDIWCRESATAPWRLQLMLDEASGDRWVSRRDPRIQRPVDELGSITPAGLSVLAPEVQLFYKGTTSAPRLRPKDEVDFAATLPLLTAGQRHWLAWAMRLIAPSHHWLNRLEQPSGGHSPLP
jgi:hypothetical protein